MARLVADADVSSRFVADAQMTKPYRLLIAIVLLAGFLLFAPKPAKAESWICTDTATYCQNKTFSSAEAGQQTRCASGWTAKLVSSAQQTVTVNWFGTNKATDYSASAACYNAANNQGGIVTYFRVSGTAFDCSTVSGQIYSSGYYDLGKVADLGTTGKLITATPQWNSGSCVLPTGATGIGGCYLNFDITGGNYYTSAVSGVAHYYVKGSYKYATSNGACATSSTTNPIASGGSSLPPFTCGANQTHGTVNGADVCLNNSTGNPVNTVTGSDSGGTSSQSDTTKVTNGDGSTTETTTKVITNPDGSKTTVKTTTTCPQNSTVCSVNQTTTTVGEGGDTNPGTPGTTGTPGTDTSNGSRGGTDQANFCRSNPNAQACQTQDAVTQYCKLNPKAKICQPKTEVTASGCGSPPPCQGDAFECAYITETFKRNCQNYEDVKNSQEASWYDSNKSTATPGQGSAWGAAATNKDLSTIIDFNAYQASGTCPFGSIPFTIPGSRLIPSMSQNFDLSSWCQFGPTISKIILVCSALSCGFFLFKAVGSN